MASLKEIKGRIASVKSTQKITSAMKMVASAKLRKAQYQIENFTPYQRRLSEIQNSFLVSEIDFVSPFSEERAVKRLAVVVITSNSSLCGAFNSNIIRLLQDTLKKYRSLGYENIEIYPIGKKIEDTVKKMDIKPAGSFAPLIEKPNFAGAKEVADILMKDFLAKKIDRVEIIYNHFKNTAVQIPTQEQFLPILLTPQPTVPGKSNSVAIDYIVEPDKKTILNSLIPKSLRTQIYAALLDSAAAEHAARTMAMQIATDNADEILDDLTIQYNKQRQQAITSELLDIVGGSEALK